MSHLVRGVLALAAVAWLAACAPDSTNPRTTVSVSASPTADLPDTSASLATVVADGVNGIAFERPATWTRWQPNQHDPITDGPLIYLSTDPLLPACATAADASPNPPDLQGRACDWPLESLSPNGVFVDWLTTRILEPMPSAGEAIVVNGASARLQIERPGSCAAIGGDETIHVIVPTLTSATMSNIAVIACLRGPDLATTEAQVRAMLASATVSQ